MARQRIGARRHLADARKHNGNENETGNPTYEIDTDWDLVLSGWPCERLAVSGGERVRGRQVTENTTHVFFGEYYGGQVIRPPMRLEIKGIIYNVNAAYDPEGDNREWRVETKIEQ